MDGNFYDGRKKWYIFQNLEKSVAEMLTKVKTRSGSNESLFLTRCLKVITVKLNFLLMKIDPGYDFLDEIGRFPFLKILTYK